MKAARVRPYIFEGGSKITRTSRLTIILRWRVVTYDEKKTAINQVVR